MACGIFLVVPRGSFSHSVEDLVPRPGMEPASALTGGVLAPGPSGESLGLAFPSA